MGIIYFSIYFILSFLPVLILSSLFFDFEDLKIFSMIYFSLFSVLFIYLDKFILFFLKSNQVFETDNPELFEPINRFSFETKSPRQKLYVYSGTSWKAFALSSRGESTVVLSRKISRELPKEHLSLVVNFLCRSASKRRVWLQTKSYGLMALSISIISFVGDKLFLSRSNLLLKCYMFTFFVFMKPYFDLLLGLANLGSDSADVNSEVLKDLLDTIEPAGLEGNLWEVLAKNIYKAESNVSFFPEILETIPLRRVKEGGLVDSNFLTRKVETP